MKHIAFILSALLALTACQDELPGAASGSVGGMTEIILQEPVVPVIQTRAEDDRDSRVEDVILFIFDANGQLCATPIQQAVSEVPETTLPEGVVRRYKVRAYLPQETKQIYAVCNYDKANDLIDNIEEINDFASEDLSIIQLEEAFKGRYVMTGSTTEITTKPTRIELTRVASKQSFNLVIGPLEKDGDDFELSSISVVNAPMVSNLMETEHADPTVSCSQDAVYATADMDKNYLPETLIEPVKTEGKENEYTFEFSLFENRRGSTDAATIDIALDINDGRPEDEKAKVREVYKKDLADGKLIKGTSYPCATYVKIEGIYKSASKTQQATYYVYLGKDNYGDFNIIRNCHYQYTVTIKAADDADSRVDVIGLGAPTLMASDEPYDAHFNVREALLYSPEQWEVYVEDPDKTPWLEISMNEKYLARPLDGQNTYGSEYAQFRLTGGGDQLYYIYIHTDEYVPPITDPSQNDDYAPRIGYICYRRTDGSGGTGRYQVIQYPAQLVVTTAWDINAAEERELKFFVERFEDNDYLTYGFEKYWSNTQINLISTGLFDGLSTTRKSYAMALWGDVDSETNQKRMELDDQLPMREEDQLTGKQNAAYWTTDEAESNLWKNVPIDIALGSALAKNRDRNGNGRIDYNEILWYLPAIYQLEDIKEATIQDGEHTPTLHGTYTFPDEETNTPGSYQPWALTGNYWSITPSVSDAGGITPGRAYYMNMDKSKRAIGLRDQAFKVLVCRDANGWLGPDDADGNGHVTNDDKWNEDNNHNSPR